MESISVGSLDPTKKIQQNVLVYSSGGLCPTLLARGYKDQIKVLIKDETRGQNKASGITELRKCE